MAAEDPGPRANHTGSATASGAGVSVSGVVAGNVTVTSVIGQDGVLLNERVIAREMAEMEDPVQVARRLSGLPAQVAANVLARLDINQVVAAVPSLHETTVRAVQPLLGDRELAGLLRAAATAADEIDKCHQREAARLGAESSVLRIAPPNEARPDNGHGFWQQYQHGAVYWTAVTGAQPVRHGIYAHFDALGGPAGRLAYPVTAESDIEGHGAMQRFQDKQDYHEDVMGVLDVRWGATVYWSEATGAHSTWGGVGEHFERLGGPRGGLAFPTTEEEPFTSARGTQGWRQFFQNGIVYWSRKTGGVAVFDKAIDDRFGFPIGRWEDAAPSPHGSTGLLQRFEGEWDYPPDALQRWSKPGGATLYFWMDDRDLHYYGVNGGIGILHEQEGGTGGWLGFPLCDETDVEDGRHQEFEGGTVFWTPRHGAAVAVRGPVPPDLVSRYGFPLGGERQLEDSDDRVQFFERGVRTVRDGVARFWT